MKFYSGTYNVEKIISQSPAIPTKASEIEFIIKWGNYDSSFGTQLNVFGCSVW